MTQGESKTTEQDRAPYEPPRLSIMPLKRVIQGASGLDEDLGGQTFNIPGGPGGGR